MKAARQTQTCRRTGRPTYRQQMYRLAEIQAGEQMYRQADKTDKQVDRHANRYSSWTDRQAGGQVKEAASRQTGGGQTDTTKNI